MNDEQEEAFYQGMYQGSQKYNAQPELLVLSITTKHFQFKEERKMEICYLYLIDEFQKMQQVGNGKIQTISDFQITVPQWCFLF